MHYTILGIIINFITYIAILALGYYLGKTKALCKEAERNLKNIKDILENGGNKTK